MNQTDLWNQLNARLDYGFLIVLIITTAVVIARWAVGPSHRLNFDRLTLGLAGGMMTVSLAVLWFK
jgi:hypothetical protein